MLSAVIPNEAGQAPGLDVISPINCDCQVGPYPMCLLYCLINYVLEFWITAGIVNVFFYAHRATTLNTPTSFFSSLLTFAASSLLILVSVYVFNL